MATADDSGFQFLLRDGKFPFRSSRCFIVADPSVKDPKAWTLELDPPENARWVHPIDDVKAWMLHGKKDVRQIFLDKRDPLSPFREIERSELFRAYVRKLLERLPETHREKRKIVLMPSIADEVARKRYRSALEASIPGVTVVPEPEMVAEYFRLLQQTLELKKGHNNVVLVVDVGASTANMTIIVSRRDATIVEIDAKGAERDLRIRALRGDSASNGGRWVDEKLAELVGVPDASLEKDRQGVLRAIEAAKLKCSRTGQSAKVLLPSGRVQLSVDTKALRSVSEVLWRELVPLFRELTGRLYENQTSTSEAKRRVAAQFRDRSVAGPKDAHRLIDVVLIAGGTSLLPGFQDAMMQTLFGGDYQPTVLRVGESFPVAAAAGALAHSLRNYDPPRLRQHSAQSSDVFEAEFDSTLPFPLVLGIKETGAPETQTLVLDPDDSFIDDGGRRPIEGTPILIEGSQPRMRLIPGGPSAAPFRIGRKMHTVKVRKSPGRMELEWNPDQQRANILSDQVDGTSAGLWIEAHRLRRRQEPPRKLFLGNHPVGTLAVDGADDVVLDVGMSKIVAIAACPGSISPAWLDSAVTDGLESDSTDASKPPLLDELPEKPAAVTATPQEAVPPASQNAVVGSHETAGRQLAAQSQPQVVVAPPVGAAPLPTNALSVSKAGGLSVEPGPHWDRRVSDQEFSHALQSMRESVSKIGINIGDLTVALLALAVRPVVLLAGPPGCGKSTLVRVIARLLGKARGSTYHEIPVQAHWVNDAPLFGTDGALRKVMERDGASHLILFDEVNLTRPEYFLSRFFYAVENRESDGQGFEIPSSRAFGTLNIDDTSRPPSPKILDRCFLIELSQVPWDIANPIELEGMELLRPLPGLPDASTSGATTDPGVDRVLQALQTAVTDHHLRHDLLPSRRVLSDLRAILGLHHRLDCEATGLLRRDDLVDRFLSSRILVRLSGAYDQIKPALEAVEAATDGMEELHRTRLRLKLAREQARLGFVSPWQ